ncbi:Tap42 interacting protein [Microbotryomycetes sp. JL221]|nr:Tap42 interacting protein [Microbotryomycetes sp. JL221]
MATAPNRRRAPQLFDEGQRKGITVGSWTVSSTKRPILNAQECDDASSQLDCPLPEICFGNNALQVCDDETGLNLEWTMLPALQQVAQHTTVKVAHADTWRRGQAKGEASHVKVQKPYDWTYTTTYLGDVKWQPNESSESLSTNELPKPRPPHQTSTIIPRNVPPRTTTKMNEFEPAPRDHPGIPLHTLARTDIPILFYDEVPLFEDELGDNGIADLTCRVRVNSTSAFILSRFFLRIDLVLFRVFDVRVFVDFEQRQILRETRGRQASYNAVKKRIPFDKRNDLSLLTDVNWVSNQLDALSTIQHLPAQFPDRNARNAVPARGIGRMSTHSRMAPTSDGSTSSALGRLTIGEENKGLSQQYHEDDDNLPEWDALGTRLQILQL